MVRLRPASTAAIVVSTLAISLAIAGSRLASADTPPGERDGRESAPIDVNSVLRSVDRSLALLEQVGEETAAGPHSTPVVEETSDDDAAKSESRENVSKAVDGMIEFLRRGRAQDATETERLGLYTIDVTTGEVLLVRDKPIGDLTYFGSPSWSNDGQRILFDASPGKAFGKTRLKMFYVAEQKAVIKDLGLGNCPSPSPDGERVAFLLNPGVVPDAPRGIWLMRADGSERRHLGGYGVPKWSPDGKQLLIISFSSPCRMSIMDVETAEQCPVRLAGHNFYSNPGWAGDGQTLVAIVSSGGDAGIALVDVTDPEEAQVKQILWRKGDRIDMSPFYPVYSPKTDLCVFVGRDQNGEALYTVKPGQFDPPKRLEPTGYDGKISRLSFSRDARYVLFCSDRLIQPEPAAERTSTAAELKPAGPDSSPPVPQPIRPARPKKAKSAGIAGKPADLDVERSAKLLSFAVKDISDVRIDVEIRSESAKTLSLYIADRNWANGPIGEGENTWATLEVSDQIRLESGALGHGMIFSRSRTGVKQFLAITKDGQIPYGKVKIRETGAIVRTPDAIIVADIEATDGSRAPISLKLQ